jgi:hypothetical protein
MITYQRTGGFIPPHNNEKLQIEDDGTFSLWRSAATASIPPSPVGSFAGSLEPALHARIQAAAQAAAAAGNLTVRPKPGSVMESIALAHAKASLGIHDQPDGPWGTLIGLLRPLLGDLTRFPRAALALEVLDGGRAARLVRRGPEAMRLDLSHLKIEAILWRGDAIESRWSAPAQAADASLAAGTDWTMDLPFQHGFTAGPGSRVAAHASLNAFDGEKSVPVALQA